MARRNLLWELTNAYPSSIETWQAAWSSASDKQKLKFGYLFLELGETKKPTELYLHKVLTFMQMINSDEDRDIWWTFVSQTR